MSCTGKAWECYNFKKLCEQSDSNIESYCKNVKIEKDNISDLQALTTNEQDNDVEEQTDEEYEKIEVYDTQNIKSTISTNDKGGHPDIQMNELTTTNEEEYDIEEQSESLKEKNEEIEVNNAQDINNIKQNGENVNNIVLDSQTEVHFVSLSKDKNDINNGKFEDNSKTTTKIFGCKECFESFERVIHLDKHMKSAHPDTKINKFVCSQCNQIFSQAQTLARHAKIHQINQRNKLCTFCGKCFMRSDDLKRHTRIHTGERPYACDKCPKKYKQTSELKEHQKSHLTEKFYQCTECGKALATRNGLYVHMKVHRGEKNHECILCGKKYVTSGELTSHEKHIHSKVKPFACTISGCTRAFVTKLSLRTHLQAHSGEKTFKCNICQKGLATASNLVEHQRTHTVIKRKQCLVCQRRLLNSEALKKHMRTHAGERPYQCLSDHLKP